jgi:hypothetical protein
MVEGHGGRWVLNWEARQVKGKNKSMLIISSDIAEIVYKKFVLAGQTVNSTHYYDVLRRWVKMCEGFVQNFGKKRSGCCITIRHLSHFSFLARKFLTKTT